MLRLWEASCGCIEITLWLNITFGRVLGVSVKIWTKNILYWLIVDQTHFGILLGAQMRLTPSEPK